jgi:NADPH:quinone reductase
LYKAPSFPYILGREGAGKVISAPAGSSLKAGDEVVYMAEGAYSDYIALPAGSVHKIPEGVSAEIAAASLLQALTAWTLVDVAVRYSSRLSKLSSRSTQYPVQAGDYVLVTAAAGGTGQWLVTMAKSKGAKVIATCSTSKIPLVEKLGADVVIDYSTSEGKAFSKLVLQHTPNGEGVVSFLKISTI